MKALARLNVALGILGFFGAVSTFAVLTRDPEQYELEARAAHVFDLNRQVGGRLPAHEVRALSLALTFHDHAGAKRLLSKFEQAL